MAYRLSLNFTLVFIYLFVIEALLRIVVPSTMSYDTTRGVMCIMFILNKNKINF